MLQEVICDKNEYNAVGVVDLPQSPNDFETSFIMSRSDAAVHSRTNTRFPFSVQSQKQHLSRECHERLLTPVERQRSKSSSPKQHAHRKASSCSSNSLSMLKSESSNLAANQNNIP